DLERVVDDGGDAPAAHGRRQRRQVADPGGRVGDGLQVQHPGVGAQQRADLLRVGAGDAVHLHAPARLQVGQEPVGAAVQRALRDDVVAGAGQRGEHGADRAHPGPVRQRPLAPLQVGEGVLQRADGGRGAARVQERGVRPVERADQRLRRVEDELVVEVEGGRRRAAALRLDDGDVHGSGRCFLAARTAVRVEAHDVHGSSEWSILTGPIDSEWFAMRTRRIRAQELAALLGYWSAGRGPLYLLLAGRLRRLVDEGALPTGTGLPPDRALAAALAVGRTTVVEAYE